MPRQRAWTSIDTMRTCSALAVRAPVASDVPARARRISPTRYGRLIICRLGNMGVADEQGPLPLRADRMVAGPVRGARRYRRRLGWQGHRYRDRRTQYHAHARAGAERGVRGGEFDHGALSAR